MQYKRQAYQQSQMMTAARGDVLLSLYDGAIRFVGQAKASIDRKDIQAKGIAVNRATAIIDELTTSLDHTRSPELCSNLAALYSYFMRQIHRASLELQPSYLTEVESHLHHLRQTWQSAVAQARKEGHKV